jgi:hypothetical protein
MISFEQRIARIQDQSKIVYLEDMTIHNVEAVSQIGNHVFVTTSGGMMFQDVDVFTLDEIYVAETAINKLKKEYKIK